MAIRVMTGRHLKIIAVEPDPIEFKVLKLNLFESDICLKEANKKLRSFPGLRVIDNPDDYQYVTPVETAGDDAVFVSRIRRDKTLPHGLSLWVVADNTRKGAALNAVQIAEHLIKDYL